jgi:hypothetical protein
MPIDEVNGSSGWSAYARVVDPAAADPAWRLAVKAICVASS